MIHVPRIRSYIVSSRRIVKFIFRTQAPKASDFQICTYNGECGGQHAHSAQYSDVAVDLVMLLRRKPRILALNTAALDAIEPALLVLGADKWLLAAGRLVEAQIAHRRLTIHKSVSEL